MTDTLPTVDLFTDRHRWGDMAAWRRDALALHDHGPIHRIERAGFDPFWAVIGHADVLDVERRPAVFTNAPQPVLASRKTIAAQPFALRTLVHLDAPDHLKYRKLTADWFRPASLNRLTARLDELSERAIRRLEAAGGTCDFAVDIALPFPLEVILEILGLPEEDFPLMLRLTQEWLGNEDPDLRRANSASEDFGQALRDIMKYFTKLTAERQANPTDDLASLIANGVIDGEPLSTMDRLSYYLIIATAGHDTTSYAIAEAMAALLDHPEQLALLQAEPTLMSNAVEEMLRWSSPARNFMRTAQEDTDVAGQAIAKGDWLYLSYPAANLDPTVFEDPLTFDLRRANADRQISFGYGVHFCIGAQLARLEMRSLFRHVLPRLASVELAGVPAHSKTTTVGGIKRLPIRYQLTPARRTEEVR
jgi:cytochrome P450